MNGLNVKFGMRDNFLDGLMPVSKLLEYADINETKAVIDARGLKHKELNDLLRESLQHGVSRIVINNVFGQRYIGTRLYYPGREKVTIEINNFPGNDLGAFLNGHRIIVHGNAQDGVGNTMDAGEIIVHGRAGDVAAMSMRGGQVFIRDNVGYRAAIHMKEYRDRVPVLVIGGTAQDFLGEYMAGGILILLGLTLQENELHRANYIGTGMHGGVIYLRGHVEQHQLGREVGIRPLDDKDKEIIRKYVVEYCRHFDANPEEILQGPFIKLLPVSKRPYGKIYAY
jgi:glutamate synthase domain-containing protein 3